MTAAKASLSIKFCMSEMSCIFSVSTALIHNECICVEEEWLQYSAYTYFLPIENELWDEQTFYKRLGGSTRAIHADSLFSEIMRQY